MTRNHRLTLAVGLVVALVVGTTTDASAQCAMCKTMLATPEGQKMVAALRSGILLLLAAPFAIFGTIATLAVRSKRRREAADAATQPPAATSARAAGDTAAIQPGPRT